MAHSPGCFDSTPCQWSSPSKGSVSGMSKTVGFSNPLATSANDEQEKPGSSNVSPNRNVSTDFTGSSSVSSNHHPLLRVGSRSKLEALMTAPGADAATLRRNVESLQLDLEAHIENEQRLQVINQELRDRLETYMKQNHENVERAESEFNTLHEDMEQTLELQRRLAQKSATLEKEKKQLDQALKTKMQEFEEERSMLEIQIAKMSENLVMHVNAQERVEALQAELEATLAAKNKLNFELQDSMAKADFLRQNVEKLSSELSRLIAKDKKDQMLEKTYKKCLLRRCFLALIQAIKEQNSMQVKKDLAVFFAKSNCCRRGFLFLQTAARRSKLIRLGYNRHAQACLENCFNAWRLYHISGKKYRQAILRRQRTHIYQLFSNWWKTIQASKMSEGEENRLTLKSRIFRSMALKKCMWKHWTRWVQHWVKPLREKLASIRVNLENLLYRQALSSWKFFIRLRRMKQLRLDQAYTHVRIWCQRRAFYRWRQIVIYKFSETLMNIKCSQFRKSQMYIKPFKGWLWYVRHRHQRQTSKLLAFTHHLNVLQAKGLESWKRCVKQQEAEAMALQEVNRALKKAAMLLWQEFRSLASVKKQKLKIADVFKERQLRKVAKQMLLIWWEDMRWKKYGSHFISVMKSQRRWSLLKSAFYCWIHFTLDSLLIANAKSQTELLDAKAQYETQKKQTTAVDVENLQLIDQLHAMSSEIAHLKIAISEKTRQEEDLHRSLEDTAVIESSMKAELEQQHIHIEELEMETIKLQKKLQLQNVEDNVGDVQHGVIINHLENTMKDLYSQIEQKSSQIESYAKTLKDTADKLEGTSDESQEQLSNAFEIAASLRKILDDRESQFATLEGNCRRRELELEEMQRKLDLASTAFSETIETRNARIRELESRISQKQSEVRDAQQEMQDLQIAYEAKESLVQRLEYDRKLKSERDSSRTKAYVSSLSSWTSSASQLDAMSGLRSNAHSLQMESMKHVYMQTKAALNQGRSPEHCFSGYRLSGFNVQSKPPSDRQKVHGLSSQEDLKHNCAYLAKDRFQPKNSIDYARGPDEVAYERADNGGASECQWAETAVNHQSQDSLPHLRDHRHLDSGRPCDITQPGQRTIFQGVKPLWREQDDSGISSLSASRSCNDANQLRPELSQSANLKAFLEPVDSLHVEIQQLQARILDRIKASSNSNDKGS